MYLGFPIYDFKSGLRLDKEPFALPFDAFDLFQDAYLKEGAITKRQGVKIYAYVDGNDVINEATGDGNTTNFSFILFHHPIKPGTLCVKATTTHSEEEEEEFNDDGEGNLTSNFGGAGTVNYETGEVSVNFNYPPADGEYVVAAYIYYKAITGFKSLRDESGNIYNYIFDTETIYRFKDDGNIEYFADYLDSDKHDYVQAEEWRYKLFCTNNKDYPFYVSRDYSGYINIDFDNDGSPDVDRCSIILEFKERLLLFNITEKGTLYPQRIRWCKPNNPDDWTNDEYLDIPTSEMIISAQKINDKIIIWCSNSIWELLYTGDSDMPFIVRCVAREIRTFGRMSSVVVNDKIYNITDTGIIITDGLNFERIDIFIPSFTEKIETTKRSIIYGFHYKPLNQIWWAYPSKGYEEKNKVLFFDYLNRTWGIYNLKVSVMGEVIMKKGSPTWNSVSETWDELDYMWDENSFQDEIVLNFLGGYKGNIYIGLTTYKDNDENINLELSSANLNPYLLQNVKKVSFGWIDFYVKCVNSIMIVEFFLDNQLSPILIKEVDLSGTTEKKWVRVRYGGRGQIHKIKIKCSAPTDFKIYAIVPYFKPLGNARR